jgi:hypothetical protein
MLGISRPTGKIAPITRTGRGGVARAAEDAGYLTLPVLHPSGGWVSG